MYINKWAPFKRVYLGMDGFKEAYKIETLTWFPFFIHDKQHKKDKEKLKYIIQNDVNGRRGACIAIYEKIRLRGY